MSASSNKFNQVLVENLNYSDLIAINPFELLSGPRPFEHNVKAQQSDCSREEAERLMR